MRNQKHQRVADDRYDVESEKRAPMSPKIDKHAAGIGVKRAEQCAQGVVEADDKNTRAQRLQIFRDKPHPEFFARADDENGEQQNDEIALESKKIGQRFQGAHVEVVAESCTLFKRAAEIVFTTV